MPRIETAVHVGWDWTRHPQFKFTRSSFQLVYQTYINHLNQPWHQTLLHDMII